MSPLSAEQVLEILADPRCVPALRHYFGIDAPPGCQAFSGRPFDFLGQDSGLSHDRDRFTAADLLAVQCLSITVPIEVALDLLEGALGLGISDLLRLLARERPHLIPVRDHVVRCAFGCPDGAWLWLDDLLRARGGAVLRRLGEVRTEAKMPSGAILLRVLDVTVWMRHRNSHRPTRCPGL